MKPDAVVAALFAMAFLLTGCATQGETPIPEIPPRIGEGDAVAPAPGTGSAPLPYPFTTCAVIRKDLKGKPKYKRLYRGHEIHFCCTPCLHAFETNPEAYFPRIAEAAAARARGEEVHSGW